MRVTWALLVGFLAVSSVAAAANTNVLVGQDAPPATAYLRYFPDTVVVHEGDTVTWTANSLTPHTVTQFPEGSGSFDSSSGFDHTAPWFTGLFGPGGVVTPGATFSHTFNDTGANPYFCKLHFATMQGVIQVVPEGQGGLGLPSSGAGGAPRVVYVDAGSGSGDTSIDAFFPANVTIEAGTTVVWTNRHSSEPHTVTAAPDNPNQPPGPSNPIRWDSSPNFSEQSIPMEAFVGPTSVLAKPDPSQPGAPSHTTFSHTFDTAGTYTYFCKLHPPMWGTVVVLAAPSAMAANHTGDNMSGNPPPTNAAGSAVPGFEAPLTLALLGLGAVVLRRRA